MPVLMRPTSTVMARAWAALMGVLRRESAAEVHQFGGVHLRSEALHGPSTPRFRAPLTAGDGIVPTPHIQRGTVTVDSGWRRCDRDSCGSGQFLLPQLRSLLMPLDTLPPL